VPNREQRLFTGHGACYEAIELMIRPPLTKEGR
jgi:hypothetical protein